MSAIHDAAKAAALAERDRLTGLSVRPVATDYVVGRCVEAALAVIEAWREVPGIIGDGVTDNTAALQAAINAAAAEDAASEEVGDG